MFKREERQGQTIGYSLDTGPAYLFFGNRFTTRDSLKAHFPHYDFRFLKQVHGKTVIPASTSEAQADAHFTTTPGTALVSQTADCVPVLLAGERTVCAIHSGWRGTAQNIVHATASIWNGDRPLFAAVGPHIMSSSFEVGHDVAAQLSAAAPNGAVNDLILPHKDKTKVYFDLTELIRRQIQHAFGRDILLAEFLHDTPTNPEFHSFRRDRERAGRQYSFVVLKD